MLSYSNKSEKIE